MIDDRAKVLKGALPRFERLKYAKEISPEGMFDSFLYMVTTFAKKDNGSHCEIKNHYCNDACHFEIGCFALFSVDVWLFRNRKDIRHHLFTYFYDTLGNLFAEALQPINIENIIDQRLKQYGDFIRANKELEDCHRYLLRLLQKTRDNCKPELFDYGCEPLLIMDVFEDFELTLELRAWETHLLPVIFKMIEESTAHFPVATS